MKFTDLFGKYEMLDQIAYLAHVFGLLSALNEK
jgi:hypothetical protein